MTPFARWWIDGAVELGQAVAADVVYASMSPYETATAAARLSARLGRPWVADLRDPWALDEMIVYPTALHRRRELRAMRRVLAGADAVVMNTPEAAERLTAAFPEFAGKRVEVIANGFDPGDFAGPSPERDDDRFRIVHTGYLHTALGRRERSARRLRRLLGGAYGSVDILTRSHVFLLDAIRRLATADPEAAGRIEIHLAGVLSDADLDAAAGAPVHAHGYVSHAGTVALMRSADLLFLPMHDLAPGQRAGIVPGKTYEYLGARRPILAAVPDGDARDLLQAAGSAYLCRPADVDCMADALGRALEAKRRGETLPPPREDLLRRYERRALTERLASVFAELAGREDSSRVNPRRSPSNSLSLTE